MTEPPYELPRRFPPLKADHWLVKEGQTCPGCKQAFREGDVTTVVVIGPGDSAEARARAREGRAYNAVGISAHYACVTGDE